MLNQANSNKRFTQKRFYKVRKNNAEREAITNTLHALYGSKKYSFSDAALLLRG